MARDEELETEMLCFETETRPSRPRLQKTGLETRLETETMSRDSITGMVWLPKPACVIASVRLRKALKGAKQSARPRCPLQKLLLIKKVYHLNTLHLYPVQTRKRTKKELPNSYIKL